MPLINCKNHLELNWIEDCILSSAGYSAKFKITGTKLHMPIVTLSTKHNVNQRWCKRVSGGFKRYFYWNNYQTISARAINQGANIYELISASFQVAKRLFVFVYVCASYWTRYKIQ